jgi:dolichyl-phosphate beta-glucosyltransferase
MTKPRLSIIIPAFREAHIIKQSLDTLYDFLVKNNLLETTEVIVVAAQAGDDTGHIANEESGRFSHFQVVEPRTAVGKGRDVRRGFLAAHGSIQLFTDADLATPLHHILDTLKIFETTDSKVVIGVRSLGKIHSGIRAFISRFGNVIAKTLLGMNINDTQCGYKAFTAEAAALIFKRQTVQTWGFDMELLYIAKKHGQKIYTQSIPDWHDPRETDTLEHEHRVGMKVAVQTLGELCIIRYKAFRGKYS